MNKLDIERLVLLEAMFKTTSDLYTRQAIVAVFLTELSSLFSETLASYLRACIRPEHHKSFIIEYLKYIENATESFLESAGKGIN